MKCCDSGLQRRKNAVNMLHNYVDETFESQSNIILLGDDYILDGDINQDGVLDILDIVNLVNIILN